VVTSVLLDAQDSHGGGLKANLRRSTVTGWGGDWRGGTAVSRVNGQAELYQRGRVDDKVAEERQWLRAESGNGSRANARNCVQRR
jgi:hypothetical protein